jgi:putative ABC transport system permease protein
MQLSDTIPLTVTGVVKDVPANAHFHFDFLISTRKFQGNINSNWGFYNFYTYVKLKPNSDITAFTKKVQEVYKRNTTDGPNIFYVQPLTDIHLTSNLKWELEPNSDKLYVYVFTIIGIFILLIAGINYVNLSTAKASVRAKEIGVRKVLGASVSNIVMLLSKDFIKLVLIAFIIASPVAWIVMNKWLQDYQYRIDITWSIFVVAGLFALIIALLTVSFQAIKSSVANPVKSLRTE